MSALLILSDYEFLCIILHVGNFFAIIKYFHANIRKTASGHVSAGSLRGVQSVMERYAIILTPLEMLLINLFVLHRCSQRKYSSIKTYLYMGLSICTLMYISYILASFAPDFGSGNGLFIFSGLLFIIPIKLLYTAPGVKIITVACFSWTYTFMLFVVSARLGYTLAGIGWNLRTTVLLLQTFLYIATFSAFYKLLQTKFMNILENIGKREAVALMWMTMMWFWTVFIFNLSFSYQDIEIFQIISLLTLAVCILSSFHYIYMQVSGNLTIQNLENIAYRDELTQLRTRVILNKEMDSLIVRRVPFHLIFLDLNDFKSINDRYGHLVGDQYLAFFAYEIKVRIGNCGGFYRIAGDEFVCVIQEESLDSFIEAISVMPDRIPNTPVKFIGFSYGIATFPMNGDTADSLLEFADRQMYEMKRVSKGA